MLILVLAIGPEEHGLGSHTYLDGPSLYFIFSRRKEVLKIQGFVAIHNNLL